MLEKIKKHNLHATICKDNGNLNSLIEKGFNFKIHNGFAIIGANYISEQYKYHNHSELRDFLLELNIKESVLISTYGDMTSSNTVIYSYLNNQNKYVHQINKDLNVGLSKIGVQKNDEEDEFTALSLWDYPTLFNLIK
jgi:hypothetical protein